MIREDILALIPQRPPVVMVDEFLGIDGDAVASAALMVREDNIFVERGCLSDCGLIEHQAQAAAARMGYLCRLEAREIPLGFIGSVRNFQANRLPACGERVVSRVVVRHRFDPITLVGIESFVGEELIVSSEMKIFLQDA